ncbi:MAG: cytochrome c [Alphaproteobacteria bacterium]|nr:cytochrome c [Alphaproteobacteria bacterium]
MKIPRITKNIVFFGIIACAIIGIVIWQYNTTKSGNNNVTTIKLRHNNSQIVSLGKAIYFENCASCHGDNLQGQKNWRTLDAEGYLPAPPHDETGHTWHHSDINLFLLTKYGVSFFTKEDYLTRMPRYETLLTDDEIIAVLSYIKSTWPQHIQEKQNHTN